jgi:predicted ester cyclase
VPATGRTVAFDTVDVMRVVDGRIAEHWGVADRFGLIIQLAAS